MFNRPLGRGRRKDADVGKKCREVPPLRGLNIIPQRSKHALQCGAEFHVNTMPERNRRG